MLPLAEDAYQRKNQDAIDHVIAHDSHIDAHSSVAETGGKMYASSTTLEQVLSRVGLLIITACSFLAPAGSFSAERAEDEAVRQSLDDAWWTGPILAPSAATLPQGHFLVEPYLYDSISYARYDANGDRHDTADTHFLGSQTYVLYGLIDTLSIGVIPRFGFRDVSNGRDSSGIRVGDVSVQAQYRMTQFNGAIPTTSVVMQATLPTGKHDQLGDHTSDGMGGGAYSLMIGLYSQHFFWMPNGRILRTRFNVTHTFIDNAELNDVSVYGTQQGFRGRAKPGDSFLAIAAAEYSITSNWVLAMDLQYQRDARTEVSGSLPLGSSPSDVQFTLPSRRSISVAPAVEYNFNSQVGVIVGAIWTVSGRNTDANFIPVVALNMVY
jgi:hypothetical protein